MADQYVADKRETEARSPKQRSVYEVRWGHHRRRFLQEQPARRFAERITQRAEPPAWVELTHEGAAREVIWSWEVGA